VTTLFERAAAPSTLLTSRLVSKINFCAGSIRLAGGAHAGGHLGTTRRAELSPPGVVTPSSDQMMA